MSIDFNHSDEYTEEEIHLLIEDFPHKFGLKEIKISSFHNTPDFFAIDNNNVIGIELELNTSNFKPHVRQISSNMITHCFYLYDDWKDTPTYKKPENIKFIQIKLDKDDLKYLDTEIYERLQIRRGLKHIIDMLAVTNQSSKEYIELYALVNKYFLLHFKRNIKELSYLSFYELKLELFKITRCLQIKMILDYNIYLKKFYTSRPIFLCKYSEKEH